ncbi:hypothetical protein JCGZ_15533 [Jatropha curcas]|uniref:Retrotransposon Copia-like N-terminal domain-containing protein n=1 Tax=Jatropha curcas TaxID=180498 RepID=A0A067K3R6_JATCU|nr:hypothetical protein JCGZ_15533 [Jatropha curcas]
MTNSPVTPNSTVPPSLTSHPLEDINSPYYLHHSENHGSIVVTPELTSSNFATWHLSFLLTVSIRN